MSIQNEKRKLLETMLGALERIEKGIESSVDSYLNALRDLISMDRHNVDIVISYIPKLKILKFSHSIEDQEEKIKTLGQEYNRAIHRIMGKDYQETVINFHVKKITTEFIIENDSSILFKNKEKFDVEYHKMLLCKMLLVNDNISFNSDTTFLCHEYIKLLSQLGNEKEVKYADIVWRYMDEEERMVRNQEYAAHLSYIEASDYEIKKHEVSENKQRMLFESLEAGYTEVIEYFLGRIEKPIFNFDKI